MLSTTMTYSATKKSYFSLPGGHSGLLIPLAMLLTPFS